jgi:hypothetical protein
MVESKIQILNSEQIKNVWKILIVDNIMWNLPFTLEDIIFIPLSKIKNSVDMDNFYYLVILNK